MLKIKGWIFTIIHCFLFCGTRSDRFKGLYWDGEGFILM
ncbi:MAG TPA: transposase [Candidatus Limosilactobacillus faecipullorum]|nr:transposase [Candidatus Limosilactobacillus faecipullorum]